MDGSTKGLIALGVAVDIVIAVLLAIDVYLSYENAKALRNR